MFALFVLSANVLVADTTGTTYLTLKSPVSEVYYLSREVWTEANVEGAGIDESSALCHSLRENSTEHPQVCTRLSEGTLELPNFSPSKLKSARHVLSLRLTGQHYGSPKATIAEARVSFFTGRRAFEEALFANNVDDAEKPVVVRRAHYVIFILGLPWYRPEQGKR